jgi:hypothetical protein
MPETHNLSRDPRRILYRVVYDPKIAEPAKRFLNLGLPIEMPYRLLEKRHRI